MEFDRALQIIAGVMRDGGRTHSDNDWLVRPPEFHIRRAQEHLRLLTEGDQPGLEHLSHAATRLLMALTLWGVSFQHSAFLNRVTVTCPWTSATTF